MGGRPDDAPEAVELSTLVTYVWGARRRPFVHPLRSPAGHVLTVDAPVDHPWHHGLWFTVKYVNGDNFWEEMPPYGVLRHRSFSEHDDGWWRGAVEWVAPDRETVVAEEVRSLRTVTLGDHAYALDFATTLMPTRDVELDRTPFTTWGGYGGLTLRGRPDWHDTRLLLADGSTHDRVLGDRSSWCALSGPIADTGDEGGVAFLDHPENPNHPVPWYASTRAETYGDAGWSNFVNAAFLWDEPMEVRRGDVLGFRYRLLVHDGPSDPASIAEAHRDFAG